MATKERPKNANGCYDRPDHVTHHYVPDGYVADAKATERIQFVKIGSAPGDYIAQTRVLKRIPLRFERACMYDLNTTDPRCEGCKHQKEKK